MTKHPKKKEQILQTAGRLFMRFGFKRISVEEICAKASVSKMTFYKYFPNKSELIKVWWNEIIDEAFDRFNEVDSSDIPFSEKIKFFLKLKKEYAEKLSGEFINEYMGVDPEMKSLFNSVYERSAQWFLEFIADAQERGNVRRDMRPEFMMIVINKLLELPNEPGIKNLYPIYSDLVMEINNFLFYGILERE